MSETLKIGDIVPAIPGIKRDMSKSYRPMVCAACLEMTCRCSGKEIDARFNAGLNKFATEVRASIDEVRRMIAKAREESD